MSGPAIAVLALFAIEWLLWASLHGEPRNDKYDLRNKTIDLAIFGWLLWLGGFFQ